jgi:beta-lactamase regulating signal transducer with metallopeptidase domain
MDLATAAAPAFFWSWIVPLALQGLVLLAAAAIVDWLMPASVWPELRLAAGTVLLLKLLLPPRLVSPIPWTHPLAAWTGTLGSDSLQAEAPDALRRWALVAGWVWLAGVLLALALLAFAAQRLRRQWRRAEPAPAEVLEACRAAAARLGLRRVPPVRVLGELESPFVFCALAPRVLMPAEVRGEHAEHALLHELAHVRRQDLFLAWLVGLVRVLYWFHPFVHAAAGRLANLREICCDRSVARRLGAATTQYRRTLLSFAARRHRAALAALSLTGGSSLLLRLRALESIERDRPRLRRSLTLAAATLALACALPLAPAAERRAAEVTELITRPPGCMQLRFLVLGRLAEEQRRQPTATPEEP